MISDSAIFATRIYFSHSQFQVFDRASLPGHHWTQGHYDQAFARTAHSVSFGTPLEFGDADVLVHLGPYEGRDHHTRVIEIPFEVMSGVIVVGGPEEFPVAPERVFELPIGHYRLTAAQAIRAEDGESVDLYFEALSKPLAVSRIVVSDERMNPPTVLLESADDP